MCRTEENKIQFIWTDGQSDETKFEKWNSTWKSYN